jgi:NAD(P)-dependent dehydrogenase (short-subunit alcohol dehydrogenase family)
MASERPARQLLDPGLEGKCVVIAGAAGGIGQCVTRFFAAAGANLVVADIRDDAIRVLADSYAAAGTRAMACAVDVTVPESARAMAQAAQRAFGGIDVLVCCAGIDAPRGIAWEMDDQHWRTVIDADLSGSWWCAKAVIPPMIAQRSGRIILIGSSAGRRGNRRTSAAYNAAKAGINGLCVGLAAQLEGHGVLVNVVAPGPTGDTGEPPTAAEIAEQDAMYPLGFGGAEPIAHACLYLAGRSGAWISGSILNVSGGRWHG